MDVRELYNALQLAFCCIICCIIESCRALRRRWCSSSRSCRRSCRRTSPVVWTPLLPLGNERKRAEHPGCCCGGTSTSSLSRGAPLGGRLCLTSYNGCSVALRPQSAFTIWVAAMRLFMCKLTNWKATFMCSPGDSVLKVAFGCTAICNAARNVQRHLTSKQH